MNNIKINIKEIVALLEVIFTALAVVAGAALIFFIVYFYAIS